MPSQLVVGVTAPDTHFNQKCVKYFSGRDTDLGIEIVHAQVFLQYSVGLIREHEQYPSPAKRNTAPRSLPSTRKSGLKRDHHSNTVEKKMCLKTLVFSPHEWTFSSRRN